jgi:hypothetical protein
MDDASTDELLDEPTGIEKWMANTLLQQRREQNTDGGTASCSSIHEQQHYLQTTAAQPKAPLQGEHCTRFTCSCLLRTAC